MNMGDGRYMTTCDVSDGTDEDYNGSIVFIVSRRMIFGYCWVIADRLMSCASSQIQYFQMEMTHHPMSSNDLTPHRCQDTTHVMETTLYLIRDWLSKMICTRYLDGI